MPRPKKLFKSGPLRMHFRHSGAKVRVLEQNIDNSYEPLLVSVSVLNHLHIVSFFSYNELSIICCQS